jgi:Fe-S-cluster containining protein
MPVPRCGFSRARDIGTESSSGSLAILFMATWPRRWRYVDPAAKPGWREHRRVVRTADRYESGKAPGQEDQGPAGNPVRQPATLVSTLRWHSCRRPSGGARTQVAIKPAANHGLRYAASMDAASPIDRRDLALVQIVDRAMADAARRSGPWLVCRLGCTACCMGPFAITQLDARRLRRGLAELESRDPGRALRIRERAGGFRGDEDEPCPALDLETGACDLYAWRPITCRAFGPPVRCSDEAVGVCELCYQGAGDEEIAACEVEIDPDGLESALLDELERTAHARGETTVAGALAS